MKDVKPCHKKAKGIGGVTCEVALSGTQALVFVTADSKFSVELENVLYSPNLGYNLFSPSALCLISSHGMVLVVLMV